MTLLVAFKQPGLNCIISDMRVTYNHLGEGRNSALKTGILFPGCIYGITGAAEPSRRFIRALKEFVHANKGASVLKMWSLFEQFVLSYEFDTDPNSRFDLVLSERSTGKPRFVYLESSTSKLHFDSSCEEISAAPFGGGKDIVQHEFQTNIKRKLEGFFEYASVKLGRTPEEIITFSPYIFCHWLNELSLGEYKYDLESKGVGGVFHFIYQNGCNESRQGSAWHIITSINKKDGKIKAVANLHKIVPLSKGIGVHSYGFDTFDFKNNILLDTSADYEVSVIDDELINELQKEFDSLKDNAVWGLIGYAHPKFKQSLSYRPNCQTSDYLTDEGNPSEYLKNEINQTLAEVYR
ncbi:hypothetical protein [uncultured Ferrimonas sp.]|uniref:hypothetical protein n=1 Tax=uncultured Ferrimonas sp. TaxID=432640 RepID=UPI00260B635D|nr:hypothetical protein [uncultured Ferrimonas sp.]